MVKIGGAPRGASLENNTEDAGKPQTTNTMAESDHVDVARNPHTTMETSASTSSAVRSGLSYADIVKLNILYLQKLPSEIHLEIISHLDYPAFIHLRATNRYFRSLPSTESLVSVLQETEHEFLDYMWVKDGHADNPFLLRITGFFDGAWYPCYTCFRIRRLREFTLRQIRDNRNIAQKDMTKRFCIDCGTVGKWAKKGSGWTKHRNPADPLRGTVWLVLCQRCKQVDRDREPNQLKQQSRLCTSCFELKYKSLLAFKEKIEMEVSKRQAYLHWIEVLQKHGRKVAGKPPLM